MNLVASTPRRRATDHVHEEYWEERQQHRYEDRMANELKAIREEISKGADKVESLSTRLTLIVGAMGVLAFLIPVVAPFIRSLFNISP